MEKTILLPRARVKLRAPGCRAGNLSTVPSELTWLRVMSVPDANSKMIKNSGNIEENLIHASKQNLDSTVRVFTKHTITKSIFMDICSAKFYPSWKKNVQNTGLVSGAPLSTVRF